METLPHKLPSLADLILKIPTGLMKSNDRLTKAVFHDINNKINVLTLKLDDLEDTLIDDLKIDKQHESVEDVSSLKTSVMSINVVAEKFRKFFCLEGSEEPMALVKKAIKFLQRYRAIDLNTHGIVIDDNMITEENFVKFETAELFYVLNKLVDTSISNENKKLQFMFESDDFTIRTEKLLPELN